MTLVFQIVIHRQNLFNKYFGYQSTTQLIAVKTPVDTMPVKLSTSHDVNLYHIKAENILLRGKIRILSVAIKPVTVIHNFLLICIGEM